MSVETGEHVVIADLHGSDEAFANTLFVLDAVDTSGTWTREGASLTLLGDILADRNEHGLEIVKRVAALRPQIEAAGGELNVVAGNHEVFALLYLSGNTNFFNAARVGFRELFRLAMDRDPANDGELMNLPSKEDFLELLQKKDRARSLLDFLARLKLFHTVEHEGGTKTLFLHAPPNRDVLTMLLNSSTTLNARFQKDIAGCLTGEAGPLFPPAITNDFKPFQWGEWAGCPSSSDPLWTELHTQQGVKRVICGHRKSDQIVKSFGTVEAIALDRNYGMFPRLSHPDYWKGAVSGGILDKRGVFKF